MSQLYRDAFGNKRRVFLAVVHVTSVKQAAKNALVAKENGADGVFLISHHCVNAYELTRCYHSVRHCVGDDYWVGVNFLDLTPPEAVRAVAPGMDGLWLDTVGVSAHEPNPTPLTRSIVAARKRWEESHKAPFLLFGGVAFKGQPQTDNPKYEAALAVPYVDVITTSGDGTGFPPTEAKIRQVRAGAGECPVAIASGMTAENVSRYPEANCFFVGSSIGRSFTELDPAKVKAFAEACRSF